jgi:DNA primase
MELHEIKTRLSIATVLNRYNLKPDKHNKICCPFHEDKSPSLVIYPQTNTWYCFGCSKTGDAIEFIEQYEKCTKHEAILKAQNMTGAPSQPSSKEKEPKSTPPQTPEERTRILTKIFETFKNGLYSPVSVKPKEYLKSRNLNLELLEMGYNSGQFHHRGGLNETDKQACINAGLLIPYRGTTPNATGTTYTPFAKDCIIFPLRNKQSQIVSLYGRSIQETADGTGKHYYLKDRTGLYPQYPTPDTQKLILTEAIIDAATLLQWQNQEPGTNNQDYEILACYGTNGLTEEHKTVIRELARLEEIIFFFDGDKAGRDAIKKYQEELLNELPGVKLTAVETPENEDINSLLQGHEPEIFTHLLDNRKLFSLTETVLTEEQANIPEVPGQPEPIRTTGKLNTRNPEFITYTTEELQIILLGGINLGQVDRLRITLKISRTDTKDPLHSIRHTLDLYHSDYLEKFINKASEQLEISTTIIKLAIAELTEQIEAYRLSKIENLKEQKPQTRQLTEERKAKAIKYLKSPNLLHRTNEDIGKTGVVGEETNRLLMYLVFTSRLREQPLHIVSLGASGTGKTYLQEKISELIPEEAKLEITILSENAFYYFDRKELKNKLVLIEDMDGAMDVLYPLRELQTKRKISKTVPIKDSKGNLRTITLHVEGPICLAGTTTKERLYEDNANRSLLIYLDNSPEHKELIMEYQRKASAGKINTKQETELKEFFKDLQCMFLPVKVRNPYAEYLKLPEHVFKPLRTNAHYLAFIETITFYHQYQRELKSDPITGEAFIETTLEDIEWANKLLKDVLLAKADELSKATREFFERLKKWLKTTKSESFYAKETRETFRMTSSSCNRYILELLRNNYIKITGGNQYRQGFEYQVIKLDEYQRLQQEIKTVLDETLKTIKKQYPGIPTVSQAKSGILNNKEASKLMPVSQ